VHSSGATCAKERKSVNSIKKYFREKDMTFLLTMFDDLCVFPLALKNKRDKSDTSCSI
jgi:hypothetical protein